MADELDNFMESVADPEWLAQQRNADLINEELNKAQSYIDMAAIEKMQADTVGLYKRCETSLAHLQAAADGLRAIMAIIVAGSK